MKWTCVVSLCLGSWLNRVTWHMRGSSSKRIETMEYSGIGMLLCSGCEPKEMQGDRAFA